MQINNLTAQKSFEIALKCVQKDVKNASKIWFFPTSFNIIAMPNIRFVSVAFQKNLKMWKVHRRTGGWMDNGRRDMTIAHLCALKGVKLN